MQNAIRKQLSTALAAAVLACGGDPGGPSTGSLSVTIRGLPGGSGAAVTVSGPGGYSQPVSGSQTLSPLTPGTYTVAASNVTVNATTYSGSPSSQTVFVNGAASASVTYSAGSSTLGGLLVNINGLPSSANAAVTVTGPDGYNQAVTSTQTLANLTPGSYTISAQNVFSGGQTYTASPTSQNASVAANETTGSAVTYSPPESGSLNLRIDGMYLTQSTQTYTGTVPLVQNRDGFLRVFVVANELNVAVPKVRVRYFQDLVMQSVETITRTAVGVPQSADESSLSNSWNIPVPGSLIRPGLSVSVEVDPDNEVTESNERDNTYSAQPLALTVRSVPTLNVTFVPIEQRGNGLAGNVTAANQDAFLQSIRRMHPIAGYDAVLHAPVTTTTSDTLEDDNANGAWGTILAELNAIRVAEGTPRYYYGVVKVSYNNGVAGVAYVSTQFSTQRSALGWDYLPSGALVAAHELGHNWGRNHAPCGDPSGPDPQYPHPDGSIGVYGLDVAAQSLKPPTTSDVMGYCDPKWIGDYTYRAVMDFFSPPSLGVTTAGLMSASVSNAAQPALLVWGHIRNGKMVLEPAFHLNTRPKLPSAPGPYSIEARAADGATVFNLSFSPDQVADIPGDQKSFVFAVPLSAANAARIGTLRLSGQGRQAVSSIPVGDAAADPQLRAGVRPEAVEIRRAAAGRVALQWNARAHPMVMVRHPRTGEVLSLARGGKVQLSTTAGEVDLVFSDGVKSRIERTEVRP
ncbi:MAG: zinc-dependent metalloprotease family protein [Gemmatimonadales bacterium]